MNGWTIVGMVIDAGILGVAARTVVSVIREDRRDEINRRRCEWLLRKAEIRRLRDVQRALWREPAPCTRCGWAVTPLQARYGYHCARCAPAAPAYLSRRLGWMARP